MRTLVASSTSGNCVGTVGIKWLTTSLKEGWMAALKAGQGLKLVRPYESYSLAKEACGLSPSGPRPQSRNSLICQLTSSLPQHKDYLFYHCYSELYLFSITKGSSSLVFLLPWLL